MSGYFRYFWTMANTALATLIIGLAIIIVGCINRQLPIMGFLSKSWASWILRAANIKVVFSGFEKIDQNTPYVLMINHVNFADVLLPPAFLPFKVNVLAKKELFKIPVFGWALRAYGVVEVDRQNCAQVSMVLDRTTSVLEQSRDSVMIYPEGTRSKKGVLGKFKTGGARMAIKLNWPLLPIAIRNSAKLFPKKFFLDDQVEIAMLIGDPIDTGGKNLDDRHELTELCRENISILLADDKKAP